MTGTPVKDINAAKKIVYPNPTGAHLAQKFQAGDYTSLAQTTMPQNAYDNSFHATITNSSAAPYSNMSKSCHENVSHVKSETFQPMPRYSNSPGEPLPLRQSIALRRQKKVMKPTLYDVVSNFFKDGSCTAPEPIHIPDTSNDRPNVNLFEVVHSAGILDDCGKPSLRKEVTEMSYARDAICGTTVMNQNGYLDPAFYNEVSYVPPPATLFDKSAIQSGAAYNDKLVDSVFPLDVYRDPRIVSCGYEYAPGIGRVQVCYIASDDGFQSPLVVLPKMTPHDILSWKRNNEAQQRAKPKMIGVV